MIFTNSYGSLIELYWSVFILYTFEDLYRFYYNCFKICGNNITRSKPPAGKEKKIEVVCVGGGKGKKEECH